MFFVLSSPYLPLKWRQIDVAYNDSPYQIYGAITCNSYDPKYQLVTKICLGLV